MHWGYRSFGNFIINARSEELKEKKTFKKIVETNRCVVFADGYFEWKIFGNEGMNAKNGKVPYFIRLKDKSKMMPLAAIYFKEESANKESYNYYVVILTQTSSHLPTIRNVHDRAPLILDDRVISAWLDTENYSFF